MEGREVAGNGVPGATLYEGSAECGEDGGRRWRWLRDHRRVTVGDVAAAVDDGEGAAIHHREGTIVRNPNWRRVAGD